MPGCHHGLKRYKRLHVIPKNNRFLFNSCCSNPARHSVHIDYLHKSQSRSRVGFNVSYGCLLPHAEGHERPREKYKLAWREERKKGLELECKKQVVEVR